MRYDPCRIRIAVLALKQARSATAIAKNTCSSGCTRVQRILRTATGNEQLRGLSSPALCTFPMTARPRKNPRNSASIPAVFPAGALAISSVFCDFVTLTSLVLGLVAAFGLCFGCGARSNPTKTPTPKPVQVVDQREKQIHEQTERISELEVRIAMLETTVRDLRSALNRRDQESRTETIRIGGASQPKENIEAVSEQVDEKPNETNRPLLRLRGEKRPVERPEAFVLPEAPAHVTDNLSVVPLPQDETLSRLAPTKVEHLKERDKNDMTEYRVALGFVRQRKYGDALQALSDFITTYTNSAYLDSAFYWRGEVYYAQREYEQALKQFETVTTRFPLSVKVPDSLLKIGMCHKRLGNIKQAQDLFLRLRQQYPKSDAARIASAEGSS
jgi:tol-pal system protein YbgF